MTVKITGAGDVSPEVWRMIYDAVEDFKRDYPDRMGASNSMMYTYRTVGVKYHVEVYRTKTMVVAKISEAPEQISG